MTRNDDPTCLPAALSAATGRVSIVTGKPLFQIRNSAGDHLQDWHMAETAEGALIGYRRMLALRESARNNPRQVQEAEIMPPPAKLLIRRVPPSAAIERFDDPDEFLYHVTGTWNVGSILEQGFLPDCRSTFTNYAGYTKGKLFLTERGGVPYWVEKVRNHLWHNHDNPPGVAVLRVPRAAISTALHEDAAELGTPFARRTS
jgi:hypothetical protein